MSEYVDRELREIVTINLGRHVSFDGEEECLTAVKKEVLIDTSTMSPDIIVRTVCDECGTIDSGIHTPHQSANIEQ